MRQIIYDKVKHIADKYKGYIDTEDLMKEGLTNRQIGLLTAEGKLEKVAHGHYWIISPKFSKPEDYKAVEVARVNRKAVICADSACYYMGLIDKEPEILSIATRRSDRHKMKMNFEVSRHYFSEQAFEDEKHVFDTKYGSYNVYGIDRSVCDCIRFREDIDKDIFELVIENYRRYDKKNEERLMAYAKAMRIGRQVEKIGLDR